MQIPAVNLQSLPQPALQPLPQPAVQALQAILQQDFILGTGSCLSPSVYSPEFKVLADSLEWILYSKKSIVCSSLLDDFLIIGMSNRNA